MQPTWELHMLETGQRRYRVCLLDTNVLSEMVRSPESAEMRGFLSWSKGSNPPVVPAFNAFTLLELRRRPELFDRFVERFSLLPIIMVKAMEDLVAAELMEYERRQQVDFVSLAFTPVGGPGNQISILPELLDQLSDRAQAWHAGGLTLTQSLASNARTAIEAGEALGHEDLDLFVMSGSLQVLAAMESTRSFVEREHGADRAIDLEAFPSVRAMGYTVFYKFYEDPRRTVSSSDGFDVMISSSLPYVDAVITERHQAEVLRKVKRRDTFLEPLEVLTLRDLRRLDPSPTGSSPRDPATQRGTRGERW